MTPDDNFDCLLQDIYFRKRENWFIGLLIKLKILKPKYIKLGGVKDVRYNTDGFTES